MTSGTLDRATLVLGVLLLVALLFLSWHGDGPPPSHGGAPGRTAVQGPGAAAGIAAAVVTLVTVAWLALATLPPRPPVPGPSRGVLVGLAVSALAFVLLKLAADLDVLTRGAWLSVIAAAALAACRLAAARSSRRAAAVSRG
ncbi:MAG: hypothetical protein ACRD2W_06870 [Acidimicrobiales bacterium]